MKLRTKILGSVLAAATMLVAGGASATTYLLGDLSATGELSKSVKLPATTGTITDFFQFDVSAGTLLTYAQLEDTLNSTSSVLTGGSIQLEQLVGMTWTPIAASFTNIGARSSSYILPTPEVDLGAGTYRLDVVSTEYLGKKTNYTVGIFGEPVPEPATWAVMLLGFGSIGASMRNRRKQAALTA